jgi:hypothetical protein
MLYIAEKPELARAIAEALGGGTKRTGFYECGNDIVITSDQQKTHRVSEVIITNCKHDDPDLAAREMLMTQLKNRRAKSDKTYHLMVSFRHGEDPTPETIRRVETELRKRLGFAERQRIAVVHRGKNSVHLHVAINKIHPKRFSIRAPYMDHFALGKECENLEAQLLLRVAVFSTLRYGMMKTGFASTCPFWRRQRTGKLLRRSAPLPSGSCRAN